MRKLRKMTIILISCLLIVVMAGCSGNNSEGASSGSGTQDLQGTQTHAPAKPEQSTAMPTPDPNKQSTLVFTMYKNDPYLQDAKIAYEKKHPNIKIDLRYTIKNGSEDVSGVKQEKFQSTLIADFLKGEGPDMIVTDNLPSSKYVGKGLLADVGRMMSGDPAFSEEQYFQNILNNLKESDGGLYTVPLSFSLSAWMGDQEALEKSGVKFDDKTWTWNQFIDTGKALSQLGGNKYALVTKAPQVLLSDMVSASYPLLMDRITRKAHFDSDFFIRMLEQIKTMEAEKVVSYVNNLSESKAYFTETVLLTPYQYFISTADMKENRGNKPKLYEKPKAEGQQPGGYFSPLTNIAINSKSSLQPEAWDFLKFLMSGEASTASSWGPDDLAYEGQGYNGTFPISRTVYEAKTDKLLQAGEVPTVTNNGTIRVTKEDLQELESILLQANKPIAQIDIGTSLFKESPAFFSGQKSAPAVAKILQNKATTYLNE
ncbi:multiple sugar transport system substrate-binding protein [Paenibacillus sp. UNCCL117]|uniref:ABC transporter substrate-binding protein n=1 Tax=unclassified Paenibacillus TaxID=185978 RepID=UPI00088EA309|nr:MULTISPECIES: ABC transporter substrate-binding protein [unclassified Paenibacillus]SDE14561.1 multiple sugar transport system substrate-binding protein [Paenibacillus sp. cl123]SFW60635.1 multiple sugar transport system substrate-binding protein [Paenibacillus sp. UNCCL117]